MELDLHRTPDEIRERFATLQSGRDVANLLEVPYTVLVYHLYRYKNSAQYLTFSVPKRSGGTREINAPNTTLKILQRKLNHVLGQVFVPRKCVYGFVPGRSIVGNARIHSGLRVNFVFNIDLKDFFPSIHYGRVKGAFAKGLGVGEEASRFLARICCMENGVLPQGAPTSGTISNLVCMRMDRQMLDLARQNRCMYTRYADDMTFSTDARRFPRAIAVLAEGTEATSCVVGDVLREIVERNIFVINESKVRLQCKGERHEVTGLTTNEKPNIKRKYANQIRAMLHAWDKHGYENAERHFIAKCDKKHRRVAPAKGIFRQVVKGKMDFLKMVRGPANPTYLKLWSQLATLDQEFEHIHEHKVLREARRGLVEYNVVVIEAEGENQGTGFIVKGVGLVTCWHVIHPEANYYAFRVQTPARKCAVSVRVEHKSRDISILDAPELIDEEDGLEICDAAVPLRGRSVRVLGYPRFSPGHNLSEIPGVITAIKVEFGHPRLGVSAGIHSGNSGGPVLDGDGRVIGIAVSGASLAEREEVEDRPSAIIPIKELMEVLRGK